MKDGPIKVSPEVAKKIKQLDGKREVVFTRDGRELVIEWSVSSKEDTQSPVNEKIKNKESLSNKKGFKIK